MIVLDTVGFEAPTDFSAPSYNAVHHHLEHVAATDMVETWRQFAGAWNAVAYRFQACAEHDEAFQTDFTRVGANTAGLEGYRQQRDTYECVVNACSVIEAFYYGVHAIGSLLEPLIFPMDSVVAHRNVSPRATVRRYEKAFPDDRIRDSLARTVGDPEWLRLNELRNVLVHRAAWAKHVTRSLGDEAVLDADWMRLSDYHLADIELGPGVTSAPRQWVAAALGVLSANAADFTERRFS